MKTPDPFLAADDLRAATFIRHIEIYDTLGSTNDRAKELASDANVQLPALVVARLQTAGRGRGQNKWWSAGGALTFSLLIDPETTGIATASWPLLSLASAVAVCDGLAHEFDAGGSKLLASKPCSAVRNPPPQIAIKWPNDVLAERGKVCGILIESPGGGVPAKERVVVGIGINVNNSWGNASRGAGPDGIALCDITGKQHDLQGLLAHVVGAMAIRFSQLSRQDTELIKAWQRLDFLAGQSVIVQQGGHTIEGKAVQIAADGALVTNTRLGQQRLYSGSVRVVS